MSFGHVGSSQQWQTQDQHRRPGQRQRMLFDVTTRELLGQMLKRPEAEIPVPLGQAISNLQSGDYGRAFGGSDMGSLLLGREGPSAAGRTGFAPGSFLPGENQQGVQTREMLGLPSPDESKGPFTPSVEDIQNLGIPPVRSDIKGMNKIRSQIARLEEKKAFREATGKPVRPALEKRLTKAKTRQQIRLRTGGEIGNT